jgi:hypothetical protein
LESDAKRGSKSGLNSSRLVRLLAELSDGQFAVAAISKQTFAEKLSQWLDWPDAISLAAVLNREFPAGSAGAVPGAPAVDPAVSDDGIRVRAELTHAILSDALFAPAKGPVKRRKPVPDAVIHAAPEAATYRRAYLVHQRAMVAAVGALRGQVRARLASASAALARLAALDAALDEALGEREHHLFAKLPAMLDSHFERLRRAEQAEFAPGQLARPEDTPSWLAEYRRDMQAVLLAELDIRLQPIEGMLEAMADEMTRR